MSNDNAGTRGARPRGVLMTADAVGGVWSYALDLARELVRGGGTRVDLATMGPAPDDGQRAAARAIHGLRLHESSFKLEWMQEPWGDVAQAGEWLMDLERRLQPDIVHLNGYCHAALPWRSPRVVVAHSCVMSWWTAVHGGEPPAAWDRYAQEVRRGVHAADVVVAPTRAMARAVATHYDAPRDLRVIPNGRCADGFRPAGSREPIVFTAGRVWDEAKNVASVCAVAPRLPWPVIVAGDDTAPGGIRISCGAARAQGRLRGQALCDMFSRAAIYALPARYEPFGYSPLEAALSGCALVLGDISSLREVWGEAALFVPPDNRRALASALMRLIADRSLREDYAARARDRAGLYGSRRMADAYSALYSALMRVPAAA
jgi:glycosyltransferase involved in cell wall biosynthesis